MIQKRLGYFAQYLGIYTLYMHMNIVYRGIQKLYLYNLYVLYVQEVVDFI